MMRNGAWSTGILAVALFGIGVVGFHVVAHDRAAADDGLLGDRVRSGVGFIVPPAVVRNRYGRLTDLQEVVKGGPALVIIVKGSDCLSCANFGIERKVLARTFPRLRVVFLAVGRDSAIARAYFGEHRLLDDLYYDGEGDAAQVFGMGGDTPTAALVDGAGRIVFAEHRAPSAHSTYPTSTELLNLQQTINAGEIVDSVIREPGGPRSKG